MNPKTISTVEAFDAFEAEIEAQDKKWKAMLWLAALVLLASVSLAFLMTLQELGSMNAHVSGVFNEVEADSTQIQALPTTSLEDQEPSATVKPPPPIDP